MFQNQYLYRDKTENFQSISSNSRMSSRGISSSVNNLTSFVLRYFLQTYCAPRYIIMAGLERFELPRTGLEPVMLPLHHRP